jgi:LacI family transcriptional regulator
MPSVPAVLLTLEKSRACDIKMLHGIAAYSRHHGPWKIYTTPPSFEQHDKSCNLIEMPYDKIDGIITHIADNAQVKKIRAANLPAVVIPIKRNVSGIPNITENWMQTAEVAFKYLSDLGLKHFAFYSGPEDFLWSFKREKSFCARVRKAGFKAHNYSLPAAIKNCAWDNKISYLINWLKSLPKPIGVVTWNDERGQNIIDACMAANIQVPDEVAVLGMDNDELICDLCPIPLSSIVFNHEKVGYEAAALLHQMIKQKKIIRKNIFHRALYVVARKSTDIKQIEDKEIVRILKFIKENTGRNLTVKEVVSQLSISQRTIQKKFKKIRNRSLHDEIRFQRIERVCRMLEETNLLVSEIAVMLNFSEVSDLNRCFRKMKSSTPLAYRRKYGHI